MEGLNQKLYSEMHKYFYRAFKAQYKTVTYTFDYSEQNRFTAQTLANIYNDVNGYEAIVNGDTLVIIWRGV